MNERPTREQVDAALEHYYDESQCAIERGCAAILAAEVCALRDDLRAHVEHYEAEVARLREQNEFMRTRVTDLVAFRDAADAFRARVEALAEGYEAFVHGAAGVESKVVSAYETVIEELHAALRGGP